MMIIINSEELDNHILRKLAVAEPGNVVTEDDGVIGMASEIDEDNTTLVFTLRELNKNLDREIERLVTAGYELMTGTGQAILENDEPDVIANILLDLETKNGLPFDNIQNLVCLAMVNLTGTYLLIYS